MRANFRAVIVTGLVAAAAVMVPSRAVAQNPPSGAIFDLSTVQTTPMDPSTYTQFSTTFTADNSSEYVSFAFREVPAFFSFDDACVTATTCTSSNLLQDPGLEANTPENVNTNFPVDWDRWIQAVDTSAIGVVASTTFPYGCDSGPNSGTYFWCDGSVQGYDALYQELNGLTPGQTYTISWYLTDNSDTAPTNPEIDMLVYAGDGLPGGTVPIGPTPPGPTPEPSSLVLLGTGLLGLGRVVRARMRK